MSCGDFQAFVLLLLGVYCLGDFRDTNSLTLTCYKEKCDTGSSCNKSCTRQQNSCFAVWTNNSGNVLVENRGCWIELETHKCSEATCKRGLPFTVERHKKDYYFCCCKRDLCNDELGLDPAVFTAPNLTSTREATTSPSTVSTTISPTMPTEDRTIQTLLYSVLPIFGFAVFLVFGFFMYHRRKTSFPRIFEEEPLHLSSPPSPDLGVRPIQLVEVISQGQFGTVWKADYLRDVVAVKVFPSSYKAAWASEKEIYMSCNIKHENILSFIAAEKHTDGHYMELWLVTQYQEHGSLADYLKSHVINWRELCSMAGSMASGLAYLHTEIHGACFKPCIAHRDFKSKNVLVKKDLTCCLSDFGLAVKFHSGGDPGEMHGQVGTRRYMAPEVLEGAINFTRESFLYIDVYAFALVLWELASRCSAVDGPVEDYRLPFEEEVGSHPSLEDMQQAVVHKKIRPTFRVDWLAHYGMSNLINTIEECWDQDAEARLTAQCVAERVVQFQTSPISGSEQIHAFTTVVNNTHISMSTKESTI